jgi:hypothetical protein
MLIKPKLRSSGPGSAHRGRERVQTSEFGLRCIPLKRLYWKSQIEGRFVHREGKRSASLIRKRVKRDALLTPQASYRFRDDQGGAFRKAGRRSGNNLIHSDKPCEISSFEPRSRLITIFRISTVPFGRTTPTTGFPELKSNVPAGTVRSPL